MNNGSNSPPVLSSIISSIKKTLAIANGGILAALSVKAILVLLNFTLISLAARSLETSDFGEYSILFSAVGMLSVIATIGQEPFVLRMWNEIASAGNAPQIKGMLYFSFTLTFFGSLLATLSYFIWASSIADYSNLITSLIYMFAFPLVLVGIHLVRAQTGIVLADGLGNATIAFAPILYLIFCMLMGFSPTISRLFLALAIGACVALAILALLIAWKTLKEFPNILSVRAEVDHKEWPLRSTKFWFATSLIAISQYMDVIIVGYLIEPAVAGAYFVITRLANLFSAAADTLELVGSRHLPRLYYQQEKSALAKMLDNLAWMTLILNVVGLIGILIGGYFILYLINASYTQYFPELLILCVGSAIIGTVRTSTVMLLMTGYEGRFFQITSVCLLLRLICFLVFIPLIGIWGAVTATTISFIVQAVAIRWSDRSLTGSDSSMFRLFTPS